MKIGHSSISLAFHPVTLKALFKRTPKGRLLATWLLGVQIFFAAAASASNAGQDLSESPNESVNQTQEYGDGFDEDFGVSESAWQDDDVNDPFESWNRGVFAFNDRLDRWLIKPIAQGYRKVTPKPVKRGVSNVFQNLGTIPTVANDILQWKWGSAGKDSARFLINSTLGLVGIFDVAGGLGLSRNDREDFDQTLATWGVPSGPYLMLPFFGSSTLRGIVSTPVDTFSNPSFYIGDPTTSQVMFVTNTIVIRESLLDAEKLIDGDRYAFIRDAYLQRREYLINDGEVSEDPLDEFGTEDSLEELEGFDF